MGEMLSFSDDTKQGIKTVILTSDSNSINCDDNNYYSINSNEK